jgi:hypothetical protein
MARNTMEDSADVWEEAVTDNLQERYSEIQVLTVVNIRIMALWDTTPCGLTNRYQHLKKIKTAHSS